PWSTPSVRDRRSGSSRWTSRAPSATASTSTYRSPTTRPSAGSRPPWPPAAGSSPTPKLPPSGSWPTPRATRPASPPGRAATPRPPCRPEPTCSWVAEHGDERGGTGDDQGGRAHHDRETRRAPALPPGRAATPRPPCRPEPTCSWVAEHGDERGGTGDDQGGRGHHDLAGRVRDGTGRRAGQGTRGGRGAPALVGLRRPLDLRGGGKGRADRGG